MKLPFMKKNNKKAPTLNKLNNHMKIPIIKKRQQKSPQSKNITLSGKGIDFIQSNGLLPKGKCPPQPPH